MAKKRPATAPDDSARVLAGLRARVRQAEGHKLTRAQIRDAEWLIARERRAAIEAWTAAVPKGDYCALSGRQHKLIDDAARNYSLPLDRPTIDLREALTALHDLVAANAHRLRQDLDGDRADLEEEKLRQQILGLELDNSRKEIELRQVRGDALPRRDVVNALVSLSARLRTLGHALARIDPEARDALNDFLTALAVEIESGELAF